MVLLEDPSGFQESAPIAIKAKIAGVNEDKAKAVANLRDNLSVYLRFLCGAQIPSVTHDLDFFCENAFGDNSSAHVSAEHNHAGRAAQRPAVQPLPNPREQTAAQDSAAHGHVRIQVANVVNKGLALEHGHNCADDSFESGIGQRQN